MDTLGRLRLWGFLLALGGFLLDIRIHNGQDSLFICKNRLSSKLCTCHRREPTVRGGVGTCNSLSYKSHVEGTKPKFLGRSNFLGHASDP